MSSPPGSAFSILSHAHAEDSEPPLGLAEIICLEEASQPSAKSKGSLIAQAPFSPKPTWY